MSIYVEPCPRGEHPAYAHDITDSFPVEGDPRILYCRKCGATENDYMLVPRADFARMTEQLCNEFCATDATSPLEDHDDDCQRRRRLLVEKPR